MSLKFTRVMPGEYVSDVLGHPGLLYRYEIDYRETGCEDCDHKHTYWHLQVWRRGDWRGYRESLAKSRTLNDAKEAANEHNFAAMMV